MSVTNQFRVQNVIPESEHCAGEIVINPFERLQISRDDVSNQLNNFFPLSLKVKLAAAQALEPLAMGTGLGILCGVVGGFVASGLAGILPGMAVGGSIGFGVGGIVAAYTFYKEYKLYIEIDTRIAHVLEQSNWKQTANLTNRLFLTYIKYVYPTDKRFEELKCPISRGFFIFPVKAGDGKTYEYNYISKWIDRFEEEDVEVTSPCGHGKVKRSTLEIDIEKMTYITEVMKDFKKDLQKIDAGINQGLTKFIANKCNDDNKPADLVIIIKKLKHSKSKDDLELSFNEALALKLGVNTFFNAIDQRTDAVFQAVVKAIMNANMPSESKMKYNQEILTWTKNCKKALE